MRLLVRLAEIAEVSIRGNYMSNQAIQLALSKAVVKRSIVVAIVVGTILNLINQGDSIIGGDEVSLFKAALTYMVPFCVSTYGAFCAASAAMDGS